MKTTGLAALYLKAAVLLLLSTEFANSQWNPDQPFSGFSPSETAKRMAMPPGFKATVFAGEPDVKQPIAFAIDDRGRLWVAENYTYPIRAKGSKGLDRIVVFEDTNGDGRFDRRTVFIEGLNLVSGLEVGFGGVWVGAAPYLMFIPIADGDAPKPAGRPQILLDGFAYDDAHEVLNTFTWGPDGWLYGCHGLYFTSYVGPPGTPVAQRIPINAGTWRYHPVKHVFERFTEGTSNPWGMDFDEHGQCVTEACVIAHLFQMVQGGHFERQFGSDFNPYVYEDIKTIADHLHWSAATGREPSRSMDMSEPIEKLGGGHAHSGLLVYQGDNWPEEYLGKYFMFNIHGRLLNMDIPEPKGSSMIGRHGWDFMAFNDPWSLIVNLRTGPDGSVYMIDWYDQTRCYSPRPNATDRSNGRIYKISHDNPKPPRLDLPSRSDLGLVELLEDKNNWYARHAQRLLQERYRDREALPEFRELLRSRILDTTGNPVIRLRYLWSWWAVVGTNKAADAARLLNDLSGEKNDEYLRAWLIQFLCEEPPPSGECLKLFARLAREDNSPVVRLYLASALQRLPVEDRWDIVEGLCSHAEDATDHNIPLMVWYGAEPLATNDCQRAMTILESSRLPKVLEFAVRRAMASDRAQAVAATLKSLASATNNECLSALLHGLKAAFQGEPIVPMPEGWPAVERKLRTSRDPVILAGTQSIALIFGSGDAIEREQKRLMDRQLDESSRREALAALLEIRTPGLAPDLQSVIAESGPKRSALREAALLGLGAYDAADTPDKIVALYNTFEPPCKHAALHTLACRLTSAKSLLLAIGAGKIASSDLTPDVVQQLRQLKDPELGKMCAKYWGAIRETAEDKKELIAKYKDLCTPEALIAASPFRGRVIFSRTCQQCHTLFDTGGNVGPNLTGSNRGDLDYLLESIVDPSAVIPNNYRQWTVETADGRTVTGVMKQQDAKSMVIATPSLTVTLSRSEVVSAQESKISFMPEGLLESLKPDQVLDLIRYLQRSRQVKLRSSDLK